VTGGDAATSLDTPQPPRRDGPPRGW
jgi:hypothetical protein